MASKVKYAVPGAAILAAVLAIILIGSGHESAQASKAERLYRNASGYVSVFEKAKAQYLASSKKPGIQGAFDWLTVEGKMQDAQFNCSDAVLQYNDLVKNFHDTGSAPRHMSFSLCSVIPSTAA